MGEGPLIPAAPPGDWKGGSTDQPGPKVERHQLPPPSEADFRFTCKADCVYAFGYEWPATLACRLVTFAQNKAVVRRVMLVGMEAPLVFEQRPDALEVQLPTRRETAKSMPYALRIEGTILLGSIG